MDPVGIIVLGVPALVAFVVGIIARKKVDLSGPDITAQNCDAACADWSRLRQQRCMLQQLYSNSVQRVNSLQLQLLTLLATVAALMAAGYAALAGIFTAPGAIALFAAAAVVAAAASATAGALAAAIIEREDLYRQVVAAIEFEGTAYDKMLKTCPPSEVDRCMQRPSPC